MSNTPTKLPLQPILLGTIIAIITAIVVHISYNSLTCEGYSGWYKYMQSVYKGDAPHYSQRSWASPGYTQADARARGRAMLPGTGISPIGRVSRKWMYAGRLISKSPKDDTQLVLEKRPHYAKRNTYEYRALDTQRNIPVRIKTKKPEFYDRDTINIRGYEKANPFVVELDAEDPMPYIPQVY